MSDKDGSSIDNAKSASTETFLTALSFNAIVFFAQIAVFTLIRPYFPRVYGPRALKKQVNRLTYIWPIQVFREDYKGIIPANGMDAYFFVRFLRMMAVILLPIWIVSWAVLLPLTAVGTRAPGNKGLDLLTFGNVEPTKKIRYVGHIILVYVFTGWIFYNIRKEMRHFVITRQHHLIEATHAKTVQANTILVTGIPIKYLNRKSLAKLYGSLPGGVKKIWINHNLKEVPEIYDRRLKACNKLEAAETKLLKSITKKHAKSGKEKDEKAPEIEEKDRPTHKLGFLGLFGEKVDSINWAREEIRVCSELLDKARATIQNDQLLEAVALGIDPEKEEPKEEHQPEDAFASKDQQDEEDPNRPDADEQIKARADPASTNKISRFGSSAGHAASHAAAQLTHTTKQAAMLTKQTAHTAANLTKQTAQLAAKQAVGLVKSGPSGEYPPLNSAFITFQRQIAAHLATQALNHHEPYRMSSRYNEIAPKDVVWSNLGLNPYETKVRLAVSWAATIGLVILWAFPVAFVGSISNIYTICGKYKWLGWVCGLNKVLIGIISGILPPVLLAVLMILLPIVLRLLAQFEGIPRKTGIELSLMNRFFLFQVIHSFLIVTLSSGIIAALTDLSKDLTSIPNLLASQLPKASNFFLTFTLLQLASIAGGFLQVVYLIIYYVKQIILGSTPRSTWQLKYGKRAVTSWGTIWPGVTLVCVITLGYSIISPVINGIACAYFAVLFMMYKYLFLWIMDQSDTTDTGGLFFPQAIQQLFVGMYIQQICLCALFFLRKGVPYGALMVVLIVFTAFFQMILNNSYGPLLNSLPLTLADKMYVAPEPERTDSGESQDPETPVVKRPKPISFEEERGFLHPALRFSQRTVWIPKDIYGIAEEEARLGRENGVDAVSGEGAEIDEKAKLKVTEDPGRPGELGEF